MSKNYFLKSVFLLIFTTLTLISVAQVGSLDNTFDSDGKTTTSFGSNDDGAYAMAVQSDGKIIVVGYSFNGSNNDFGVVRYNSNGSLDATFSSDGKVNTDFASDYDAAYGVALQSDGKIVVVGFSGNGSNDDIAVARYNTDGSLDATFSGDGKVSTDFSTSQDYGYGIAIQSDGKIVVCGSTLSGGFIYNFAVVRYNSDGTLDNSFDTDGKVTTDIANYADYARSVQIQTDGKIVVAGDAASSTDEDFAVVRYTTAGALDVTFSTDGKVTTPVGLGYDLPNQVKIQSDGKIVVVGTSAVGFENDLSLVRYNTDGTLDNSFDTDGMLLTPIGAGSSQDYGSGVAFQTDGKLIVAGYTGNGLSNDFAVLRLNSNGSFDNTFDSDGIVTTDFNTSNDFAFAVAIQANGKIVVAGNSNATGSTSFAVARYNVSVAGIEEKSNHSVSLYPNPTNGIVYIEAEKASEITQIQIVSMMGSVIYSENVKSDTNLSIDLTQLPAGMYILEIQGNDFDNRYIISKE